MERSVDDVVDCLRRAKDRDKKCALLIGAGCSVEAGIPLAADFVKAIENDYKRDYDRAAEKTYPKCMAQLAPLDRRDLIAGYIDKARMNWAHLCIAQLVKNGYVDRVLTTNFDPLIVEACAYVGITPAVYDFGSSQLFNPTFIPEQAVFYLHGQRSGIVMLNTPAQLEKHFDDIRPVFQHTLPGRAWIVVGYSGENDPVFRHLAEFGSFDRGLYWIGYKDSEPPEHVRKHLLVEEKYAYYVRDYDADRFFATLARELGCFPPDIIGKPFTHLANMLAKVTDFLLPGQDSEQDVTQGARELIGRAIERYEKMPDKPEGELDKDAISVLTARAQSSMTSGDYDKVIAIGDAFGETIPNQMTDVLSWAYVLRGVNLCIEAETKTEEEADALYQTAYEKFDAALKVTPEMHEALYNWGRALQRQAGTKTGDEANTLYQTACEKYDAALKVKPEMHEALYNWGLALQRQTETKTGEEADRLYQTAGEKYDAALKVKPDKHEALNNWGLALQTQAETKTGEESDTLYHSAYEKFDAALKVKLDDHEALYNWGLALCKQADTKTGEEADTLYQTAYEKFDAALKVKPDDHETLYNWGLALQAQAKTKTGEEADTLYQSAYEKYDAALKVKPDKHEALNNWGNALCNQARTKTGEEADTLYQTAYEKYDAALKVKPDYYDALNSWGSTLLTQASSKQGVEAEMLFEEASEKLLESERVKPGKGSYNLACIASLRGNEKECREWLEKSRDTGHLPDRKHLDEDTDLDGVRDTEWFKEFLESLPEE